VGLFSAGETITAAKLNAIGNNVSIGNATGAGTTTSATYANVAATSSFTFAKLSSSTGLYVPISLICYAATNTAVARLGVLIDGVDYDLVGSYPFGVAGQQQCVSGGDTISGIAAGVYTIQARWLRVSGSGTLTTDANGWISLSATEVQV
jgi:hypothetical protein